LLPWICAPGTATAAPGVSRRSPARTRTNRPAAPQSHPASTSAWAARRTWQAGGPLVISDATVKTHVARVPMKLNLADRVQAVTLAYETGLVQPGEA
jgi:Bacterial regulatory proteins, luxR family